jgi:hypothetical protein
LRSRRISFDCNETTLADTINAHEIKQANVPKKTRRGFSAHFIDLARVGALRLEDKGKKAYPWISISS